MNHVKHNNPKRRRTLAGHADVGDPNMTRPAFPYDRRARFGQRQAATHLRGNRFAPAGAVLPPERLGRLRTVNAPSEVFTFLSFYAALPEVGTAGDQLQTRAGQHLLLTRSSLIANIGACKPCLTSKRSKTSRRM